MTEPVTGTALVAGQPTSELVDAALPALAVRTHVSPCEGANAPTAWGAAVDATPDTARGRVLLADRDTLAGLPASFAA